MAIEVGSELGAVEAGSADELCSDLLETDELPPSKGDQLADGHAASCHDIGLAVVQATHDLATVVAQLKLCDRLTHNDICSTGAIWSASDAGTAGSAGPMGVSQN
ncbi:hypothetical protein [Desertimonas flava]|uniref:hypothetical protein n=1 Tax=Desertimonas flava TaxID=2064846 RepID=UPI001D0C1C84|nr:hypothetical protein [Desertimonas flava]